MKMKLKILIFFVMLFQFETEAQLSCGVSGRPSGLIVNGTESKRGAWPWVVAIYSTIDNEFLCGGSLIGLNVVATVINF